VDKQKLMKCGNQYRLKYVGAHIAARDGAVVLSIDLAAAAAAATAVLIP
jgi:hypothetical protein